MKDKEFHQRLKKTEEEEFKRRIKAEKAHNEQKFERFLKTGSYY